MKLEVLYEIESGRVLGLRQSADYECMFVPGEGRATKVVPAELDRLPDLRSVTMTEDGLVNKAGWPLAAPRISAEGWATGEERQVREGLEQEFTLEGVSQGAEEITLEVGSMLGVELVTLDRIKLARGQAGDAWSWMGEEPKVSLLVQGMAAGDEIGLRTLEDALHEESETLVLLVVTEEGLPEILKGRKAKPQRGRKEMGP